MSTDNNDFLGIVNDDFFGEDVTYVSGGVEYQIRAFVYRNGVSSIGARFGNNAHSKHTAYAFEIRISSDGTYGRTSINIKDDTVRVCRVIGRDPVSMRVMEITGQDQATFRLGLSV